ncbi:MAG: ECF-type sigma factor [Planctomycetota bacterium]|jgi:RNA polymerase sigma factor (TIGR02999 family)
MNEDATTAITRILSDSSIDGDERARRLIPLVYEELRLVAQRRLASERPDHTLDATALVHEAYMRVAVEGSSAWRDRAHFFGAAAEAMRRILVDHARRRDALKRGGGNRRRVDLADLAIGDSVRLGDSAVDLVALDGALTRLAAEDARKAQLVTLRFFAGLSLDQAAATLGISPATADRDWAYAKAFLYADIHRTNET